MTKDRNGASVTWANIAKMLLLVVMALLSGVAGFALKDRATMLERIESSANVVASHNEAIRRIDRELTAINVKLDLLLNPDAKLSGILGNPSSP